MNPKGPINSEGTYLGKGQLPRSAKVSSETQTPSTMVTIPPPLGGGKGHGTAKFLKALKSFPDPGEGVHQYILSCANYGVRTGMSDVELYCHIEHAMPRVPQPSEIQDAINKARNNSGPSMPQKRMSSAARKATEMEKKLGPGAAVAAMKKNVRDAGGPIALEQLLAESPVPLGPLDDPSAQRENAYRLVSSLHHQDDHIFCGKKWDARINTVAGWEQSLKERVPPLWIPNSLTGAVALRGTGEESYRCDNAVSDHRYLLYECDHNAISLGEQAAFILSRIRKGWSVRAVVFSGSKSLHALLEVDCGGRECWDQYVKNKLKQNLVGLGADPACFNPSRLSRLPGHTENGRQLQSLVWLSEKLHTDNQEIGTNNEQ